MKTVLEKPLQEKNIFEMTLAELRQRIKPTAEKLIQEAWDKNTFISYYDEALCPGDDTLIHEYKDRKELVRVNDEGNTELIRIL
jgi:hypothetical protein